ncbi:MAG TPA: choice-of-anchor Q domain-containing protein [Thermoleophilaceae bacterium]
MRVPLLAIAVAFLAVPASAGAATYDVTTTADNLTCNPGNCSLRGAIEAANAASGADTINLPAGNYVLELSGGDDDNAVGDLDVNGSLTLNGAGAGTTTVDAGDTEDRVFDVGPNGGDALVVALRDLTVRDGNADFEGGGVRSSAQTTLQRVVVTGSAAFRGGGVAQTSSTTLLRILDSTITGNSGQQGGGVAHDAGGHSDTGAVGVLIERSTISDNHAVPGGEGDPDGGGIAVNLDGDVRVRSSTISGNSAEGFQDASGGGAYVNGGLLEVTNSTVSGNSVTGGYGGGIANTDGDLTVLNATIAGNSSTAGGVTSRRIAAAAVQNPGDPSQPGGNVDSFGDSNTFKNTIVAGGSPQNCRGRFNTVFTSSGHNLEDANTCGFDATGDAVNTDPQLGPLAANGGPTRTRALPKSSPAIDTADNAACPATDQRGIARAQPAGGTCDKGAYERPGLDLSITKLASAATVKVGEEVRFTLAVSNSGPADAGGVRVTDALPDGLQFVSADPSRGSCSGTTTVTCELGTLAAEQDADVVIRATATRAGEFTNTAAVASNEDFPEPNRANNSASVSVRAEDVAQGCRDTVAPLTELKQSRVRVRRGKVRLSGVSYDPDPCASGVNRVLVSLARVKGRHLVNCRFLRSMTRYLLTPAPGMNCQDPVLFRAKGGSSQGTARTSYSFIYFVDLPDGIYRAQARAFDNAGNKERPTKGRNIRKFFVR